MMPSQGFMRSLLLDFSLGRPIIIGQIDGIDCFHPRREYTRFELAAGIRGAAAPRQRDARGGVLPTPRALELAPSLTDALAMVRGALGAREAFDPRRTTRSLRVYMTDVGETVLLPSLMRHLDQHGPAMRLETAQLPAAEL